MENPCPPSLPSTATAAAITTSRSSVTAAIHAPSTPAAATITTTRSNSNSGSNTDRDAGSNSGSSAAIQSSLRQLNKNSYKISKHGGDTGNHGHHRPPPPPLPPPSASPPLPPPPPPPPSSQQPPPQPQPPVYNIHKNDFRDVVQKLTGSPAHQSRPSAPATAGPKHAPGGGGTERGSPPPAGADLVGSERAVVVPFDLRMVDDRVFNRCYRTLRGSAPASPSAVGGGTAGGTSSRLQKIRPPPLAQLTPRPPPSLGPSNPFPQTSGDAGVSAAWARASPLSPLPPLPTVSAAAESPITAYMRCLRGGVVPHQQGLIPSPRGGFSGGPLAPSSPLGFGCVPSPRSACQGVLPPGLMLPPSPTPSPRWGDR